MSGFSFWWQCSRLGDGARNMILIDLHFFDWLAMLYDRTGEDSMRLDQIIVEFEFIARNENHGLIGLNAKFGHESIIRKNRVF